MDFLTTKLADGRLQLTITMDADELERENAILDLMEQDLPEEQDAPSEAGGVLRATALGKSRYCCTCGNGERHTIKASNSISAGLKCLKKCKGNFGLTKGACA